MKTPRIKSLFTGRHRARYRRRLNVEQLERRKLLASDISLSGGNLLIEDVGTAVDDSLTLRTDTNNFIFNDPINTLSTSIPSASGNGTNTVTVPRSAVSGTQIQVQLQGGDDQLIIASDFDPGSSFVVLADMGSGNDLIHWNSGALLNTINVIAESIEFADGPQTTGVQSWTGPVSLQDSITLSADFFGLGDVDLGPHTLTLAVDINGNIDGSISGTGGLVKQGPGNATLSGTSNYSGSTLVTAGSLRVTGQTESDTTIASGGTLSGNGNVLGIVTVAGTLSPGVSAGGTLNTHNLDLQSSSGFTVELGGSVAGTDYDQVAVNGSVTLAGNLNLDLIDGFAANQQFVVIDNDGTDAVSGTFAGLSEGATVIVGAAEFQISYAGGDGNDVMLTARHGMRQVTNTNDSGPGSLRQAILDANAAAGLDVVTFDIAGAGPHTIQPLSGLPIITDPIFVDGASEPDFAGSPVVELDGNNAGAGLVLGTGSDGSTIRGLVINRFTGDGIQIYSDFNIVAGNFIGTDPSGRASLLHDAVAWLSGEGSAVDNLGRNNGVLGGDVTFAPGKVGQAFSFSGDGDYVSLPTNFLTYPPQTPTHLTFETWFQTASGGVVLGQQEAEPLSPTSASYIPAVYVGTDGLLRSEMFWNGGGGRLTSSVRVDDGQFHHVAVVFNGTSETLYLDGIAIGSTPFKQNAYGSGIYNYQLGTGYTGVRPAVNGGWFSFTGLIDEPTFYERALNEAEILQIVQADSAGKDDFVDFGNGGDGILVGGGASNTVIGGSTADRNLIAANNGHGVRLEGRDVSDTIIAGNYIGIDSTGSTAYGNAGIGVYVNGAQGTVIGTNGDGAQDVAEGNVISANRGDGVQITGLRELVRSLNTADQLANGSLPRTVATGTIDQADLYDPISGAAGNWGYDNPVPGGGGDDYAVFATGTFDVPTSGTYSFAISGDDGGRLRIDGNDVIVDDLTHPFVDVFSQVTLTAGEHTFEWVGIEAFGAAGWEMAVKAGADTAGPVTSANGWAVLGDPAAAIELQGTIAVTVYYSAAVSGDPTVVAGNRIGTDASGTVALGNGLVGVRLQGGTQNNRIGTDGDGISDVEERNVIAGSTWHGVEIRDYGTSQNIVAGNYIGTDFTGTVDLGNAFDGIAIWQRASNNRIGTDGSGDAFNASERNVIAGNKRHGVHILQPGTDNNIVAGNYIGVDATGAAGLGNSSHGVVVNESDNNRIGTDGDGIADEMERNVISGNGNAGVLVRASARNRVAGNYIGTNATGDAGLGNSGPGVWLPAGAHHNVIGTDGDGSGDAAEANVISANTGFAGLFVEHEGTDHNVFAGNLIGTDATGTFGLGNTGPGVVIKWGASYNRLGTDGNGVSDELERNVISGNGSHGVNLHSDANITEFNVIAGNYIGTDITGTQDLGNGSRGIIIHGGAARNLIGTNGDGQGDAAERNVISGNAVRGIEVQGAGTDDNMIAGNYIGTDASGTAALGNSNQGVWIAGGAKNTIFGTNGDGVGDAAEGNVLAASQFVGLLVRDSGTTGTIVAGNFIGTDKSGSVALGNAGNGGVRITAGANQTRIGTNADGVSDLLERNIIAANSGDGVEIDGLGSADNVVAGNYIGVDVSGATRLGNTVAGVQIRAGASNNTIGGSSPAARNVISGNLGNGIEIFDAGTTGNFVAGNYIGTDVAGTAAVANNGSGIAISGGATANIIGTDGDGQSDAAERNLISGNQVNGVLITGSGTNDNVVAGNLVGTDATGTVAIGNGDQWWFGGVVLASGAQFNRVGTNADGTSDGAERNVISANPRGVVLDFVGTDFNTVAGNFIGTDITGTAAIPNDADGIVLWQSANNTIGGTAPAKRNLISGNLGSGIWMGGAGATTNLVQGNFIGTDATGTADLGNLGAGVFLAGSAIGNTLGGTSAAARNVISGNDGDGVFISSDASGNTIAGNYIGTDVGGQFALRNAINGVLLSGNANTIGGAVTGAGNVISGHGNNIYLPGSDNIIQGNYIGTASDGEASVGGENGIFIDGGSNNRIGGAGRTGNVISGHSARGIVVQGPSATATRIQGNMIGTNAAGTAALPNHTGVVLWPGAGSLGPSNTWIGTDSDGTEDALEGNVISGNANDGIAIHGAIDTVVAGNYVGLDASGAEPLGNAQDGIFISSGALRTRIGTDGDGSSDTAERNVISDNSSTGIRVSGTGTDQTVIAGNYVGVDFSGAAAVGNRQASGIVMQSGARFTRVGTADDDPREGNVVVGAGQGSDVGVAIWVISGDASDNMIAGNHVGLNASGTGSIGLANAGIAVSSANNLVDANRVGAHLQFGIGVYGSTATGTTLRRNYVGTDATGTLAQGGHPLGGVFVFDGNIASPAVPGTPSGTVIGGDRLADGNLLSGNNGPGIQLFSAGITDTEILGNVIGTSRSAAQDLGNAGAGIHIFAGVTGTRVGSIVPGLGNTIAFNSTGVAVLGSEASIRGNAIFSNDTLGIDLADDGVTPNDLDDTDDGPNDLQNYPDLTSATAGAFTNIKGQLESTPNASFDVDFYKSNDPAGSPAAAQGRRYLGSVTVTTDASGVALIDATFAAGSVDGEIITAVATDADGSSSEFSAAVAAIAHSPVTIESDQLILTEILEDEGYGDPASTFTEGSRVRLDGLFANNDGSASHTIEIDWGDGSDLLILNVAPGIRGFAAEHLYNDDRPSGTSADDYVISIFVIDSKGASGAASTVVTIENQAPAFAEIGLSPASGNEGDTLFLQGSFEDPGNDTHQLIIDWGDGSATQAVALPSGERSFSIPHRFLDNTSNISVRLLDDDTGETTVDLAVVIGNLPPVPAISGPVVGVEGSQIHLTASAIDLGARDTVELSWQVSAGGRLVESGTGAAISFSPPDQEIYTVSLTARDDDDGVATVTHEIDVANAPPAIDPASVQLVDEAGQPISQAIEGTVIRLIGNFIDPGIEDQHVVQVNWGDGSPTSSVAVPRGAASFDISHVYADDAPSGTPVDSYEVTVTLSDLDGGAGQLQRSIDVANAVPEVMLVDNGSDSDTVRLRAQVRDLSLLDTFTYQWQVDGVSFTAAPDAASIEFDRPESGSGTAAVTVTDDDGGVGSATAVFVAGTNDADEVTIAPSSSDPTKLTVTVSTTDSTTGDTTSSGQDLDVPGQLVIATGESDDKITIDPSLDIDTYIDGGAGDDEITTGNGNNTIDISEGDDTLNSGSGNDTVIISAFSNKVITDNGGIDTFDFSGVQQFGTTDDGVTLDLSIDDGSLQTVRGDGTMRIQGVFENILGTAFRDHFKGNSANNQFFGGAGEDTLSGGTGEDTIDGGDGNDLIFAGSDFDSDSIDGGTSDDSISGGEGNDLIFGGSGDDSIYSGSGSDSIDGGDGNDLIFGGGGDDTISAGSGDSTIDGGDGNDLIFGTALGRANLYGGVGDDTLTAGGGEDSIDGGDGNDLIFGGGSASHVFGGTGDDTISGGNGDVTIDGGDGNDLIFGGSSLGAGLYGGVGDDTIVSGGGEDTIDGGDGNDLIFGGGGGNAQIYGGLGDDTINAGSGVDSVDGGEGNDLIFGRGAANVNLYGGTGDDTIVSGGGEDTIDGGDGNDLIFGGGGGSAQIYGGLGDDTINAGSGVDSVDGGEGNDLIFGRGAANVNLYGGTGDDTIVSGGGEDTIDGGDGNDLIFGGGGGSAQVYGGLGDDTLHAGNGDDSVDGGEGNDLIFGRGALNVNLYGGIGDDTIYSGGREDSIDGGDGNDLIFGGRGNARLYGGSGDDTITGGSGSETIDGGSGNDLIFGGGGDDTITAGEGSATIDGGSGNDLIYGSTSSDTLDGSTAGDSIDGGDGNDLIYGGYGGDDTIDGGAGDDSILGGDGNDLIFGGSGNDTIVAGTGNETIDGGDGNDLIYGSSGDTLDGSSAGDSIVGGDGNDLIYGGYGGTDTLDGGGGDDTIVGGDGNDLIYGGDGDDSIAGSSSGSDTLEGGDGNDIIFGVTTGDALLTDDRLTIAGVETHFSGFEAAALYGDGGDNLLDASAATLPVKLLGGSGNDTLLGGSGDDVLQGDQGNDLLVGGEGDDIYRFTDAAVGHLTILDGVGGGEDTLNFQAFTRGITLDLSRSDAQVIVPGLTLTLSGDFENAFGTDAADALRGNSLNNKLLGYGGHDLLEGGDGDDILQAGGTRQVFLDFDSATEAGEYVYSQADRDAIQTRMEQDYAPFDIVFNQVRPASGPYVTVFFNAAVTSVPGGGRVLGGISDRIGWRELSGSGFVKVDVNGFFQSISNKLPATEENYIALSSTIASHELGHSYGLRHHDALGPPGSGIYAGLNAARFRPAYTGPAAADETRLHLSASPASIGTTLIDALGNPFFGEREALKLAFAESGEVNREWEASKKDTHTLADGTSWLVQSLGALAPLAVPNTIEQGINAGITLVAAAETIIGSIELVNGTSESDFYSFAGSAGDIVTIEVMSQVLRHRISNPIDSLLRVYNSAGEILDYYASNVGVGGAGAFNDDTFEPTDSLLLDLVLPHDGTYVIEVDTFSFGIPEIDAYLGGLDTQSFCAVNASHIACADSDTGDYELLIYRFDNSESPMTIAGDTLVGGAGADQLIGNSGSETFLGFNANEDVLIDNSPTPNVVNAAPRLQPLDTQTGLEGSPVEFRPHAQDDDGDTLMWSLETIEPVDGIALPEDASIDPSTGQINFTPPDDGLYRVRVRVTDLLGDGSPGQSDVRDYFVSVANADPVGIFDAVSTPWVEGTAITVSASATDPGANDTLTFSYTVTKDGISYDSASGIDLATFTFTPDDEGEYVVALWVYDDDGGSATATQAIAVENAPPTISEIVVDDSNVNATGLISFTADFSDLGVSDAHTATVDWGDGTATESATLVNSPGAGTISGTHIYDVGGDYTITLTVTDDSGDATTETVPVHVNRTGVYLVNGELRIFGTQLDDEVFVLQVLDEVRVYATFQPDDQWEHFPEIYVQTIRVETLGGDDYVQLAESISQPSEISAGAGTDTVLGGSGPDLIYGGNGDDHLSGRAGNDTVYGGAGNDKLWGSFGDDMLDGGDGDDQLWGNEGDDILIGGGGGDQLHGGTGRDLVIGGEGSDRLKGDTDDDILIGGTTAFDERRDALAAVMAEWTSARAYAERVSNLRDGTGSPIRANGNTFLQTNITVFDDGHEDWMLGGSGLDWFFALDEDENENEDDLLDDRWNEQVDLLFANDGA